MSKYPNDDLFENTKMSFGEHLEELRVCLIRSLMGLAIGFLVGLYAGTWVVDFIQIPLRKAMITHYVDKSIKELTIEYGAAPAPAIENFIRSHHVVPEAVYVEVGEILRLGEATKVGTIDKESASQKNDDKDAEKTATASVVADLKSADISPDPKKVKVTAQPDSQPFALVGGDEPPRPLPLMAKTRAWRPLKMAVTALRADEAFMIWMKAAFVFGTILASPWIFLQVWNFVAAGLYPHEKKYVHVYLPMSIGLFMAGAALAFFFVFEPVLQFLFSFNESMNIGIDARISEWLSFVLILPLGFGLSFQLPLVMLFLNRIGVVPLATYIEKWRIAILAVFVISMVLTPADPISMLLMALPLSVLYFLGVALCKWMPKGKSPFDGLADVS